ncbi:MAG: hypothetical protein ACHQ5A_08160 [Opitutales bacterium]
MLIPRKCICLGLLAATAALGQVHVAPPGWALAAEFPAEPKGDEFRKSTDLGDQVTHRFYLEQNGLRFLLARFVYPVVPLARAQDALYKSSVEELMRSRPGDLRFAQPFSLGEYTGLRLVIDQRRDRSVREVRLIQIGASLYFLSAEWPAAGATAAPPEMERFLQGVALRPDFEQPRFVEERERWRVLGAGRFHLRYDATRWYRDPTDNEAGVFNFLRVDKLAEAQFIAEATPLQSTTMEESVLATARENAESVTLRKRGRKIRSSTSVEELDFIVRAEGTTYINHGYFYTGPAGAVQLRAWSPEKTYAQVESDIFELLDGLAIDTVEK